MDVCYLINQLAPGGAPTVLLDIVRNTDDPDVSYTVCYLEGDDTLVPDLEAAGATVVDLGATFKFDPRAQWRLRRFLRDNDFDVLHAHLPYAQTVGRLAARLAGVDAVVSTQHNVPANYHPVTRALERLTRPIDDATVAVSTGVERAFRGDAHQFDGTLDGQWCTVYNGIDVDAFAADVAVADPAAVTDDLPADADPLFLKVARYVPAKAHETLVDAMAEVVTELPSAHLLLVGWGERERAIRERVREQGLTDHVTVTGRVPTVHEYYAAADVFVSSSTFEGLPVTHLEAMAAGLPVVSTAIPGVEEVVIDGETGRLVPPGDPSALATAMVETADPDRRRAFGRAGKERVATTFDIETMVASHLALYRTLLPGRDDGE